MKSIALIHTVKNVLDTFESRLRKEISKEIMVHNLMDDYLANNPNEVGFFSIENRNRLFLDIKSAELTGADLIITTCSTLTPIVDMIRPFVKTPIIAIDDAMAIKAVMYGSKVLVLATAGSTVEPTKNKIMAQAINQGKILEIDSMVCQEAFAAMKSQNMTKHDEILQAKANEISGYDCIILAQASMAHLEQEIADICGTQVLSSPNLCILQVKEFLEKM